MSNDRIWGDAMRAGNDQKWRDAATRSLDAMHLQRDYYIGELQTVEHDLKLAIDTDDWDAVKSLCEYVTTILSMGRSVTDGSTDAASRRSRLSVECDRYRKALEEIANQDYRGNRSHEAGIAWKALNP